jgi:hypothetical protein
VPTTMTISASASMRMTAFSVTRISHCFTALIRSNVQEREGADSRVTIVAWSADDSSAVRR